MMEEFLFHLAHVVGLVLDAIAILLVAVGAAEAVFTIVRGFGRLEERDQIRRTAWLRFARWLIAALTFQLGADIVLTTAAPTWDDIGRVAAIAVVRTFLTYFLDRDIDAIRERAATSGAAREPGRPS